MDKKHAESDFNFNQITDHIFIGTNACCQAHFDKRLLKLGIKADISLEDHHLDSPWGVKYFLWLPTKDQTAPSKEQLEVGAATLQRLVENGIKIYVHCQNGHGRSPTLVAAYLISKGMKVEEAIDLISQKRPNIHLEEEQIEALKKFQERGREVSPELQRR